MEISEVIKQLEAGNVIAIPTETVYGLAVDATNEGAVAKLFAIKGRPENKPITIQLGDKKHIERYAQIVHPWEQKIIDTFMPGPLTLVLKKKNTIPNSVTAGSPFVGVRIPQHPDTLQLLQSIDFPLAVPSANKSGEMPAVSLEEAQAIFGDQVSYYMPNSYPMGTIASTVVQIVDGEMDILRE
jgi:L-threonylcarbamoyladenylate synthase